MSEIIELDQNLGKIIVPNGFEKAPVKQLLTKKIKSLKIYMLRVHNMYAKTFKISIVLLVIYLTYLNCMVTYHV